MSQRANRLFERGSSPSLKVRVAFFKLLIASVERDLNYGGQIRTEQWHCETDTVIVNWCLGFLSFTLTAGIQM